MNPFFKRNILPYLISLTLLISVVPMAMISFVYNENGKHNNVLSSYYWIAISIALILEVALVWPSVKGYKAKSIIKQQFWTRGAFILILFSLVGPSLFAFEFLKRYTAKVDYLEEVDELEGKQSRYVEFSGYYADKNHVQIHTSTNNSSGEKSKSYEMSIYVVVPLLNKREEAISSVPPAWLGISFDESMPNSKPHAEKMLRYKEFTQESQQAFMEMDLQGYKGFDRVMSKKTRKGFNAAAKYSPYYSKNTPILLGMEEGYSKRYQVVLLWFILVTVISATIFYLLAKASWNSKVGREV